MSPLIYTLFYLLVRPCIRRYFGNWPLIGASIGMLLGSLVFSWLIWLSVHLGFPLNTMSLWSALLILVAASLTTDFKVARHSFKSDILKKEFLILIFSYFCFILCSALYMACRRYNADFAGLEKFPDLAFITSAFKSTSLPPLDPFAAGETINYYYFGHFQAAVMAHLTGRLPFELLHYQVANIFALSALMLYSVGAFIFRWSTDSTNPHLQMLAGYLSIFFGILSGNLQPAFEKFILRNPQYYYPSATRYIENVIHEFPFYSFLVGDLHGHLMNLPNAVLAVGICALFFDVVKKSEWQWRRVFHRDSVLIIVILAFSAGTSYVTNAWDIMTTLLLAGFVMVAVAIGDKKLFHFQTIKFLFAISVSLVALAVIFYLPYWLTFSPPAQGIGIVPPGKSTPIGQLALIWGVHVPLALTLLSFTAKNSRHYFLYALVYLSLGLILTLELFYFRDIYPTHFRANTVFKIGFQIWIWLSIASAVAIAHSQEAILNSLEKVPLKNEILAALSIFLIFCGAYYTWLAPRQAFLDFNSQFTLDGRDFIRRSAPEDIHLIDWINSNIREQTVILEATGDSFSEFGRVAAFTGNQTIIQWPVHEWLWRGSFDRPFRPASHLPPVFNDTVASRVEDVRLFYEDSLNNTAQNIIKKYKVKYFVVGRKEREKYPKLNELFLKQLGTSVFSNNDVSLFKVHNEAQ